MQVHHKLLIIIYPLIYLKNRLMEFFYPQLKNQIRVLLYHDIPPDKYEYFSFQLSEIKKQWNFISPDEFTSHMSGKTPLKGKNLLLTFDDGFISNKLVAESILKSFGIKAIFFVLPNFINISNSSLARKYVADYIYPSMNIEEVPINWINMNWDDLQELIRAGHTIGAHTMSHTKLSTIIDVGELQKEIAESAEILEQKLGIPIRHFAFPFGNIESFSPEALKVAKGHFGLIYSGLRGKNIPTVSKYAIRRDSVTPKDHPFLIASFLNGAADFQYSRSVNILDSWANTNAEFRPKTN